MKNMQNNDINKEVVTMMYKRIVWEKRVNIRVDRNGDARWTYQEARNQAWYNTQAAKIMEQCFPVKMIGRNIPADVVHEDREGKLWVLGGTGENPASFVQPVINNVPLVVHEALGEYLNFVPRTRWLEVQSAFLHRQWVNAGEGWTLELPLLTGMIDCPDTADDMVAIRQSVIERIVVRRHRVIHNVAMEEDRKEVKAGDIIGRHTLEPTDEIAEYDGIVVRLTDEDVYYEFTAPLEHGDKVINVFGHKGILKIVPDDRMNVDILISTALKRGIKAHHEIMRKRSYWKDIEIPAGVIPWTVQPQTARSELRITGPNAKAGKFTGRAVPAPQTWRFFRRVFNDPAALEVAGKLGVREIIEELGNDPSKLLYPLDKTDAIRDFEGLREFYLAAMKWPELDFDPTVQLDHTVQLRRMFHISPETRAKLSEWGIDGTLPGHWVETKDLGKEYIDPFGTGAKVMRVYIPKLNETLAKFTLPEEGLRYAVPAYIYLIARNFILDDGPKWGLATRRATFELLVGPNSFGDRALRGRVAGIKGTIESVDIDQPVVLLPHQGVIKSGEITLVTRGPQACLHELQFLKAKHWGKLTIGIPHYMMTPLSADCDGDNAVAYKLQQKPAHAVRKLFKNIPGTGIPEPRRVKVKTVDWDAFLARCEEMAKINYTTTVRSRIDLKRAMGFAVRSGWRIFDKNEFVSQDLEEGAELLYRSVDKYNFTTDRMNWISAQLYMLGEALLKPADENFEVQELYPEIGFSMRHPGFTGNDAVDDAPKTIEEIKNFCDILARLRWDNGVYLVKPSSS